MEWFEVDGYVYARWLVQRGVALVYVIAFVNIVLQWRPLAGERGLMPASEYLGHTDRWLPTLFRRRCPDRLAVSLAGVAVVVAALLLVGVPQAGPPWLPMAAFLVLWVLYLSFVTVGGVWYAFGWELLLLEAGVLAAFLGSDTVAPSWLAVFGFRWLLFRVELGAGLIKLRGDPCWRDLTCLEYHHETQPLPSRWSWWFHHLPRPLHRAEVAGNHVAQLVAPFGLFLPQPVAGVSAAVIIVTQGWLVISGNFAWLNAITLVLAVAALPDAWLTWLPFEPSAPTAEPSLGWVVAVTAVALAVIVLSLRGPVPNLLARGHRQRMNASHDPLRLVNSYGAFGSITRTRYELTIEATAHPAPTSDDATWAPYVFRAKPGPTGRTPRQVAPYHLRLDWLLWFAAMDPAPTRNLWFQRLLQHLLEADPATLRLLADDPMDGERPTAVRVLRERYRFTSFAQRRATGDTWTVDRSQVVAGPVVKG